MSKHQVLNLEIGKLVNDFENARHPVKHSERDVIDWMLKELGKEIFNLAQDIAIHGLSPIDRVLVMPKSKNNFTVMEGNRRVLAVKLLNNPSLADGTKWESKYETLKKDYKGSIPKVLEVVSINDRAEVLRLIKARHLGRDQGRGVIPWNPQDSARAQRRESGQAVRYEESLQIIDYAVEHGLLGRESEKLRDTKFPITTLERLLKDQAVCSQLGINYKPGVGWVFDLVPAEAHKGLTRILKDLIKKEKTVSDLKNKELRQRYLSGLGSDLPSQKSRLETPLPITSVPADVSRLAKSKVRVQDPTTRKYLINDSINVSDQLIARTFIELKKIEISEFPRATMGLIRVFFEQSIDAYLKKNSLQLTKSSGDRLELRPKFAAVLRHFPSGTFDRTLMKKLNGIANANAGQAGAADIENLHMYLHSTYHIGAKREVIDIWDSAYGPFLKVLWSRMQN